MDDDHRLHRLDPKQLGALDSLGSNAEIESEHAHLDRDLDDLARAAECGADREQLLSLLKFLIQDTQVHFANEEAFMQNFKYPKLPQHREHHVMIVNALIQERRDLEAGEALSVDGVDEVRVMLNLHVEKDDRDFSAYLSKWAIA